MVAAHSSALTPGAPPPTPSHIRLSELAEVASRAKTGAAVLDAAAAWARAPTHIKSMAGAYVAPLMAAIIAINEELHAQAKRSA